MDGIWRVTATVLDAPFTRRARRDLAFCLVGAITGVAGFVLVAVVLMPALVISGSVIGTVVGLLLVVAALSLARGLGGLHRRVLRLATGKRVSAPAPFRPGSGLLGRLDRRLRDRDGWRAVGYTSVKLPLALAEAFAVAATVTGLVDLVYPLVWLLFRNHPASATLGPLVAVAPVPHGHWAIETFPGTLTATLAGVANIVGGVWAARAVTVADARAMRLMLGPSRVSELERTRAIAVEDTAAALRRVERDLHDGAQVRLAAVAMNLGLAQEKAGDDALRELLDAAQTGVSGALADLRRIARGIHPPALDSGLEDALASLAATSPLPAQVRVDLPARPSQAIETMAYFCVAELLANAIKHSSANAIEIKVDTERVGVLHIRVTDDGKGGADVSRASCRWSPRPPTTAASSPCSATSSGDRRGKPAASPARPATRSRRAWRRGR
jgi:signal transduction histidine kinase